MAAGMVKSWGVKGTTRSQAPKGVLKAPMGKVQRLGVKP